MLYRNRTDGATPQAIWEAILSCSQTHRYLQRVILQRVIATYRGSGGALSFVNSQMASCKGGPLEFDRASVFRERHVALSWATW